MTETTPTPGSPRWLSRPELRLFCIGVLVLFLELALIRWAPAQTRVLAYFTNFVLLAAFLGLGIGTLLRARPRLELLLGPAVLVTVNVLMWAQRQSFDVVLSSDFYAWQRLAERNPRVNLPVVLVVAFVLLALPFVPLGVAMGRALLEVPALRGYAWNLAGSLAGVLAFTGLSVAGTSPGWWLATCAVLALLVSPPSVRRTARWGGAALIALSAGLVALHESVTMWSPYYRIELHPLEGDPSPGFELKVNNDYHQLMLDLSDEGVARWPHLAPWKELYELPHRAHPAQRVLIVGGGTGNDVAAALRMGAGHVDVVEIDPLILEIGRELHRERPLHDERVTAWCDDARAWFKRGSGGYDLVVFGFLDSHSLLSSMSSVRLDSYVYTVQSLREARALLADDGVLALTFSVERPWIGERLRVMLREAFGEDPRVLQVRGTNGTVYLAGPGMAGSTLPPAPPSPVTVRPATDSWPFLYFERPSIPRQYVLLIVTVAAISIVSVLAACRRAATRPMPVFFLLGAGFMLLQTRSVTSLALLFGSTWITNAVVFSVMLALALLGTWLAARPAWARSALVDAGLLVSLAVVVILPLDWFVASALGLRLLAAGLSLLPVLFAGLIFGRELAATDEPDRALGSNLLGAVAGGLAEYSSLVIGFPRLSLVAVAFYVAALLASRRVRRGERATARGAAA